MKLNKFLKQARLYNNLSLREVENITGISNSYLCQIETGKRNTPSIRLLKKLCECYKIELAEVLIYV